MSDKPIARTITKKIITALEGGVVPWRRPWSSNTNTGSPTSFLRLWRFTGINEILMNIQSEALGFRSKWWATEKQWFDLGGRLKPRPANALVSSWGQAVLPHGNYYYNIDQIQGGKGLNKYRFTFEHDERQPDFSNLINLLKHSGVRVRFGADKARYHRGNDRYIECPDEDRFEKLAEFFTTLLHEVGHWTMDTIGLDRGQETNELIVELASCYLAADLDVPVEDNLDNHIAYMNFWLKAMKVSPNYILLVSRDARRVSNFLKKQWEETKRKTA